MAKPLPAAFAGAKFVTLLSLLGFYSVLAASMHLVIWPQKTRRALIGKLIGLLARMANKFVGLNVLVFASGGHESSKSSLVGRLILANHLSYLDILVLSSVVNSLYVTSVEVKDSLGLGHLARLGGCQFVERRSRAGLLQEVAKLKAVLKGGVNLTIFPEGTSSNGETVLPFKSSLLAAATGVVIQPICIKYTSVDGSPLSKSKRDSVYWYGDMTFLAHLWRFVSLRWVDVEVTLLPPLLPTATDTRAVLAAKAHAAIKNAYEGNGALIS